MILSAFVIGLLGSFHCVGMCGPIAFVLPLDRSNPVKKFSQIILYHSGRLLSYSLLGLLFGMIGKGLFIGGLQQRLSVVIGILMIAIVLIPEKYLLKFRISQPIYRLISKVKSALGYRLKQKKSSTLFTIGILNGFLPCGLVYMALFGAVAMAGAVQSSAYMLIFGLGTLPLMSTAAYLGNFLSANVRKRIRQLIPVFVILIGVLFILRGLGLGIPYLSPSNMNLMITGDPHCITPGN